MPFEPVELGGARILITGAGGQVAQPVVASLAQTSDVYALARFTRESDRAQMEQLGARCLQVDLADPEAFGSIPKDFDYVLNFAVVKSGDFEYDLAANAEGVGRLMSHCRDVSAFLHFSSTAVYEYAGAEPRSEDAPLGDNHRAMFPTYSISKIAAEAVCRYAAKEYDIPTVIARLSVPYGDNGGWPYYQLLMMEAGIPIELHPDQPNTYNLLHVNDYLEKIPRLLAAAGREPITVNFGGSVATSVEEWCAYLSELTGFEPVFKFSDSAFGSLQIDPANMHELVGETTMDWREGIHSMVVHMAPHLLKSESGAAHE